MTTCFDTGLNREIWEGEYKGAAYRLPALLAQRYRPTQILGKGGNGVLIVAQDQYVFGRKVLIKKGLLNPNCFKRQNDQAVPRNMAQNKDLTAFERKMLLHGQLRQVAGIPTLIDWFDDLDPMVYGPHTDEDGNTFFVTSFGEPKASYLVLNYFDGIPLDDFAGSPSFQRNIVGAIRFLALYIAKILKEFHAEREFGTGNPLHFIYQDLKPDNILCSSTAYQLIDFGSFAAVTVKGKSNVGIHTKPYAAPEALPEGGQQVSPRSDIYSLGMLLSVVLQKSCGQQPLANQTFAHWEMDAGLRSFINRCTLQDPSQRYQNMTEVIQELNKIPKQGQVKNA